MASNATHLVFIPSPITGHFLSTVQITRQLVDRDPRLSITILFIDIPFDSNVLSHVKSLSLSKLRNINLTIIPQNENQHNPSQFSVSLSYFTTLIDLHKPQVKLSLSKQPVSGIVVDTFCTSMIDVANELNIPSYIYYTSGAAVLALTLHMRILSAEFGKDITEFKDSDEQLIVPGFVNPVPVADVLPSIALNREGSPQFIERSRRLASASKGILINTFSELEPHALRGLSEYMDAMPPVYPVGPCLNLEEDEKNEQRVAVRNEVMQWLDGQPEGEVVFLCFGSMGSFGEQQIMEIARGLELSGERFLWSLRRPPSKDKFEIPGEFVDVEDVLPRGFMERTSGKGKVIGWAPQVSILSHSSIGGFVSHCGWNSVLESMWYGVPIAAWPIYAEQQVNGFTVVRELGLGVEIMLEYRKEVMQKVGNFMVSGEHVERGIKRVMERESGVRIKMREISKHSRMALVAGGSSHTSITRFLTDVINNAPTT